MDFDTNPTRLPGQSPAEAYRANGQPEIAELIDRPPLVVEVLRYPSLDPQGWGFHFLTPVVDGDDWSSRFAYREVAPPRLCFGEKANEEWAKLEGYTSHKLDDVEAVIASHIARQVVPLEWKTGIANNDPDVVKLITVWVRS